MDKTQRSHAANNLLNDDVFRAALEDIRATINKELLAAPTSEERENKWHEWHGLDRAVKRLSTWASDVRHQKETK